MANEFLLRLAPKVQDLLPVNDGEEFEEYCSRVRLEPVHGRRALIAACMAEVSDEMQAEYQARKAAWITAARQSFQPGARQACVVCGKYIGLAEAHHILPLGVQFDAGAVNPIQEFEWLCPTHHKAQHVFINDLLANISKSIPGLPPEESDALHCIGKKMVEFLLTLPGWDRVQK